MAVGERFDNILFLEGLMIPFVGATIRSGVNRYASATIDIIPTDTARSILPRTLVHIFSRDPVDGVFKLAFEGETWGKAFSRSSSGRGMQIIAYSMDYHWHNAKMYYIDPAQSGFLGTAKQIQIINEEGGSSGVAFSAELGSQTSTGSAVADKDDGTPYLTKVLNGTVRSLTSRFKYYQIIDDRLKLSDRITTRTTTEVKKVFNETKIKKYIYGRSKGGSHSRYLIDTMARMIGDIHHNYVSLPNPSGDASKIKSYLFKPDCYITPPPRCNVIFPDDYSQFSYTHNFNSEPTRMQYGLPGEVVDAAGGAASLCKNFYAPKELATNLSSMASASKKSSEDVRKKRDIFYDYLPFEERLRGIIHARQPQIPYLTEQLREKGHIEKYAGNVASYQFYKQKYSARNVQVGIQYNPWIVPGFSCLIVDNSEAKQHIVAHVNTVETRLNATEGGFTMVGIDTARELEAFAWTDNMYYDSDLKKIVSDRIDEPAVPLWFDETWGTSKKVKLSELKTSLKTGRINKADIDVKINDFSKINQNYTALLGNKGGESITAWRNSSGNHGATILESAYRVIQDYEYAIQRGSVEKWINSFKQRDIPTITETFDFLDAATQQKIDNQMVGGVRYSGSLYTAKTGKTSLFDGFTEDYSGIYASRVDESGLVSLKRQVVEAYRKELVSKDGFIG